MRAWILFVLALSFAPIAEARRGCCSHHGGVCADQCCDGTALSAKCGGGIPETKPKEKDGKDKKKKEKPDASPEGLQKAS